jgi:hypothetical protein
VSRYQKGSGHHPYFHLYHASFSVPLSKLPSLTPTGHFGKEVRRPSPRGVDNPTTTAPFVSLAFADGGALEGEPRPPSRVAVMDFFHFSFPLGFCFTNDVTRLLQRELLACLLAEAAPPPPPAPSSALGSNPRHPWCTCRTGTSTSGVHCGFQRSVVLAHGTSSASMTWKLNVYGIITGPQHQAANLNIWGRGV